MKRLNSYAWFALIGLSASVAIHGGACAASQQQGPFGNGGSGNSDAGAGGMGGAGGNVVSSSSGIIPSTGGMGGNSLCNPGPPNKDEDGDGYTEAEGDCNDCDEFSNPGAVEVPTPMPMDGGGGSGEPQEPADEDCDGKIDEPPAPCDTGVSLTSEDAFDAAKAIGLCDFVQSAKWVLADGSPIPVDPMLAANFHRGHGILSKFGANNPPREGSKILMLSSGTAREKDDAQSAYRNFDKGFTSNAPYGFNQVESPACPGVKAGPTHDAAGVQLEIKAPTNAQGASFAFQFFTYEWGQHICKENNDFFVAHVEPFPAGLMNGNIAFDPKKNPISVNNQFFDVCGCPGNPPNDCIAGGIPFGCAGGTSELIGTPFEKDLAVTGWTHGSTGWLIANLPVTPGQTFRIRLVTYDSGDGNLDSSTLIDNWQWSALPGKLGIEDPDPH